MVLHRARLELARRPSPFHSQPALAAEAGSAVLSGVSCWVSLFEGQELPARLLSPAHDNNTNQGKAPSTHDRKNNLGWTPPNAGSSIGTGIALPAEWRGRPLFLSFPANQHRVSWSDSPISWFPTLSFQLSLPRKNAARRWHGWSFAWVVVWK